MIIFQESFSFNLLVANWRLSPEFWSPNIFPLAMATKMVAAWSAEEYISIQRFEFKQVQNFVVALMIKTVSKQPLSVLAQPSFDLKHKVAFELCFFLFIIHCKEFMKS